MQIKLCRSPQGFGKCFSTKLNLSDPRAAEIAAMCGFDCIWIDMEHVPNNMKNVEDTVRATKIYDVDLLTRVSKGCYSDIVRPTSCSHSPGALICTYSRREEPYGNRALVSYDLGKTWESDYILKENDSRDLGYGSTVELDDGSLLSVYYERYPGDNYTSLFYTKWRLNPR